MEDYFERQETFSNKSEQDRNQMFQPDFARGPWPETTKTSFLRTNQTANK